MKRPPRRVMSQIDLRNTDFAYLPRAILGLEDALRTLPSVPSFSNVSGKTLLELISNARKRIDPAFRRRTDLVNQSNRISYAFEAMSKVRGAPVIGFHEKKVVMQLYFAPLNSRVGEEYGYVEMWTHWLGRLGGALNVASAFASHFPKSVEELENILRHAMADGRDVMALQAELSETRAYLRFLMSHVREHGSDALHWDPKPDLLKKAESEVQMGLRTDPQLNFLEVAAVERFSKNSEGFRRRCIQASEELQALEGQSARVEELMQKLEARVSAEGTAFDFLSEMRSDDAHSHEGDPVAISVSPGAVGTGGGGGEGGNIGRYRLQDARTLAQRLVVQFLAAFHDQRTVDTIHSRARALVTPAERQDLERYVYTWSPQDLLSDSKKAIVFLRLGEPSEHRPNLKDRVSRTVDADADLLEGFSDVAPNTLNHIARNGSDLLVRFSLSTYLQAMSDGRKRFSKRTHVWLENEPVMVQVPRTVQREFFWQQLWDRRVAQWIVDHGVTFPSEMRGPRLVFHSQAHRAAAEILVQNFLAKRRAAVRREDDVILQHWSYEAYSQGIPIRDLEIGTEAYTTAREFARESNLALQGLLSRASSAVARFANELRGTEIVYDQERERIVIRDASSLKYQ